MIWWSGAVATMGVGVFVSKSYKKGKGGAGREPLPRLSLALYRRSSMKLSSKEDAWRVSDWSYTRSLLFTNNFISLDQQKLISHAISHNGILLPYCSCETQTASGGHN